MRSLRRRTDVAAGLLCCWMVMSIGWAQAPAFRPANRVARTGSFMFYRVMPGETLWRIARRHGSTVGELARVNGIENPHIIYAGQRLLVPRGRRGVTAEPTLNPQSDPVAAKKKPIPHKPPLSVRKPLLLRVGKSRVIFPQGLKEISVADPQVISVNALSTRAVVVVGRSVGETTLVVRDGRGVTIYEVQVEPPEMLTGEQLASIIGVPTITVQVVKDTVILGGTAKDDDEKNRALAIARLMTEKVLDLVRVEPKAPDGDKPMIDPQEIERRIGLDGVKVSIVNQKVVLEGMVESPGDLMRAERIASLYGDVLTLLTVRPYTAEEVQRLLPKGLRVSFVRDFVVVEGEVEEEAQLKSIEETAALTGKKVRNLVKVVLPKIETPPVGNMPDEGTIVEPTPKPQPKPPDFATLLKRAIKKATGIDIEVEGDENRIVLLGSVETQIDHQRVLKVVNFFMSSPAALTGKGEEGEEKNNPGGRGNPNEHGGNPNGGAGAEEPPAPAERAPEVELPPNVLDLLIVRAPQQVRVDVMILEVNRDRVRRLGAEFPEVIQFAEAISLGVTGLTGAPGGGGRQVPAATGVAQLIPSPTEPFVRVTPITTIALFLIQQGAARLLSAPSTTVRSGERARFNVGGTIAIPQTTLAPGVGTVQAVQREPFGIILEVTPTVEPNGQVAVDLNTTVSELDFASAVNIGGAVIPGTRTREFVTKVDLPPGHSLALGGLIQRSESVNVRRFPFLSSIPVLGELFKSRQFQRRESELTVLVTPNLVKSTAATALPLPPQQRR